jgi:hypothetical protein
MLTSRTNPVLADFREVLGDSAHLAMLANNWAELIDEDPKMSDHWVWAPLRDPKPEHVTHARKVLGRLVSVAKRGSSRADAD